MRALFLTLLLYFMVFPARAENNRYLTTNIVRARALAMGGAYHSLIDDFAAGLYNPGAFMLNKTREERVFKIFFNPVGMGTAFYDYSKYNLDFERDDKLSATEGLLSAALLVKGVTLTTQILDIGINLGEEIISDSLSTT